MSRNLWEELFDGVVGNAVPGWQGINGTIKYAASSLCDCVRTQAGDLLVRSPQAVYDRTCSRVHVKVDFLTPATNYLVRLQMRDEPYSFVDLAAQQNQKAIWDIDINEAIVAAGQDVDAWEGKYFFIDIWFDTEVKMDFVRVCDYRWTLAPELDTIMSKADPVVLAHFMTCFGNRENAHDFTWYGWGGTEADPNIITPAAPGSGKRQILSTLYPVAEGYESQVGRYEITAPYDQRLQSVVDRHLQLLRLAGIDGGIFDVESFYEIRDNTIQVGEDSYWLSCLRQYLRRMKTMENNTHHFHAIPIYEDKCQWLRIDHGDRATTLAAVYEDLNKWMELFFLTAAYEGIGYTIEGRPVLYIFSYEGDFDERGIGRLSADELKTWKDTWSAAHGVTPIIVTNIRQTTHPAELEGAGVTYSEVIDGYFEWPVVFSDGLSKPDEFDTYHHIAAEKSYWATDDAVGRYKLASGEFKFVGSGIWPGFDDRVVNGWGAGKRGIEYKSGEESTVAHHLERTQNTGYPVRHLATWNDWFEGTVFEPSVEHNTMFGDFFWLLDQVRQHINKVSVSKFVLPYLINVVRRDFSTDTRALADADIASQAIERGEFERAESVIHPWVRTSFTDFKTKMRTVYPGLTFTDGSLYNAYMYYIIRGMDFDMKWYLPLMNE